VLFLGAAFFWASAALTKMPKHIANKRNFTKLFFILCKLKYY